MILDSDHTVGHGLRELNALAPLLRRGDYLVVEDTASTPSRAPSFDPPYERLNLPHGARTRVTVDSRRERKFGLTAAPNGYLIRN